MQKIDFEIEAIQIAIYANIVQEMLNRHKELSLSKTVTFAYLIKADHYRLASPYTAKNRQDIVNKAISMLAGEYKNYCNSLGFILKAIHILIKRNIVSFDGTTLSLSNGATVEKGMYCESSFLDSAIKESKRMSDRQFLKEVTACV